MSEQNRFTNPFQDHSFPDEDQTIILRDNKLKNQPQNEKFKVKNFFLPNDEAVPFNPYQKNLQAIIEPTNNQKAQTNNDLEDPPLLEDIGINIEKIKQRIIMVALMKKPNEQTLQDPDLSGPIIIAMSFGIFLMLSGKIHFGDIYAVFITGNILIYILFNLLSQTVLVSFYNTMSALGYSLLPMLILAILKIFFDLKSPIGIILGLGIAIWSSISAGGIMSIMIKQNERKQGKNREILIIYPLFLFYVSFVMIALF